MPIMRQKNGLTQYALACGYIQRVEAVINGQDIRVDLWHEGACYHARAHNFTENGRLNWIAESSLTDARNQWEALVWEHFGDALKEVERDARYTVALEYHGEQDPSYVVRFCDEWVGKSETVVGAMMQAYTHKVRSV